MRRLAILLALACITLAACRRPGPAGPGGGPIQTPGLSLDDPEPEPASEPPKQEKPKPPPVPELSKPKAPPPKSLAGFSFGQERKDAWKACSTKGTWKRYGKAWLCTKSLEDPGFEGSPALSFCADKVCAIGFAITPEASDYKTWAEAHDKIKKVFTDRYGAPTKSDDQVPEECKTDTFVDCLTAGKAKTEAQWLWDEGHKIVLRMSKKRQGEGPPAIRLVSMPTATSK